MPVEAKVGFAIKGGVVSFLTTQTETVDLSFFPTTMTREPGTTKSSSKPRVTTLRRGNDALETRHAVLFFVFTRTHHILREFAPALAGCFSQTMLPHQGILVRHTASLLQDWELTHPIMAAEAFAVLTAIGQHRDLLSGSDVIFFNRQRSCRQCHDQG